jgi:phage gp29-like protein
MRDITDIARETIDTDPHLGSILNKRMGAVSSLPWEVQPAEGFGVDKEKALYYAEIVREQLLNLHTFRKNLNQIAWGLFDGRAVLEINWTEAFNLAIKHKKFGSPTMILNGLGWIHPRRLSFDNDRHLIIEDEVTGYSGGNFNALGLDVNSIPYKFVQWSPQRFGDYQEREGLAPRCLYWSFFKNLLKLILMLRD